jgi:hypothetical protein
MFTPKEMARVLKEQGVKALLLALANVLRGAAEALAGEADRLDREEDKEGETTALDRIREKLKDAAEDIEAINP